MAALVRLQRRKHNLIIMYGHISRMSPCLGQCTRGWCSVPTRFWHSGGVLHADIPGGFVSGDLRLWRRRDDSTAAIISMQSSRPCAVHVLIAICDFSLGNSHNFCFRWLKDWLFVDFTHAKDFWRKFYLLISLKYIEFYSYNFYLPIYS